MWTGERGSGESCRHLLAEFLESFVDVAARRVGAGAKRRADLLVAEVGRVAQCHRAALLGRQRTDLIPEPLVAQLGVGDRDLGDLAGLGPPLARAVMVERL